MSVEDRLAVLEGRVARIEAVEQRIDSFVRMAGDIFRAFADAFPSGARECGEILDRVRAVEREAQDGAEIARKRLADHLAYLNNLNRQIEDQARFLAEMRQLQERFHSRGE